MYLKYHFHFKVLHLWVSIWCSSCISWNRQHWFISRLDGASVTAGGFTPRNSNILVISTSSNQVYVFDVDAKQLGEWSIRHTFTLPRSYIEFPGEVTGLTFPTSPNASSVIVYSARSVILLPTLLMLLTRVSFYFVFMWREIEWGEIWVVICCLLFILRWLYLS